MEIIKLFLHKKQILYFPKSKNSHCNRHRTQAFRIQQGFTYKYKKQLSLVSRTCGQDEGLSMTLDSKHTKNTEKREVGGGKQGNLELLNSIGWEGGEDTSSPLPSLPARASSSHSLLGGTAGNPMPLSLACRE